MMSIIITVNQKGARVDGIEALIEKHIRAKYPEASISVARHIPPESRADRFDEALSLIEDAKDEAEELRDELQEWRDGLPENLQDGSKADELQCAIDELEQFISMCEDAEGASITFPGMYA
jgi:hypothetical protein